jgi:hypothetical protein
MAHQQHTLYTILGSVIWGDLGPVTIYRDKQGKVVAYAKTYPAKRPSPAQIAQQQRITDAAAAWQTLSSMQRDQWDLACRRASLCCNGYGLWVHWTLTQDLQAIRTLERQTHTTLIP